LATTLETYSSGTNKANYVHTCGFLEFEISISMLIMYKCPLKTIIEEEEMLEALRELSKIMKTGRAYKNIHIILNKYPRGRMGYA
jgi:hypothetical protein